MTERLTLKVAVETPLHAGVAKLLDYASEQPLAPGTLLRVPLGRRDVPGMVWDDPATGDTWRAERVAFALRALGIV